MVGSIPLVLFVTSFYTAIFSPVLGYNSPDSLALPPEHEDIRIGAQQKVTIQNSAGDKRHIWLHCFSGDDDLGLHLLRYKQVFAFKFHQNFFGGTEFFCTVSWNNKGSKIYHKIVVFNQDYFDETNCSTKYNDLPPLAGCTYLIGMNSFSGPDGTYSWTKRSKRLIR